MKYKSVVPKTFLIDKKITEKLRETAYKTRYSESYIIREALKSYLENLKK